MSSRRARLLGSLLALALLPLAGCRTTGSSSSPATPAPPARPATPEPIKLDDRAPSAEAYRAVLESEMLLERGDASAAAEQLRVAVLHDPASPWLRVRLGEVMLMAGDIEAARDAAEEALTRAPEHLEALRLLATTWVLTGEKRRARAALEKALAHHPGDRAASNLLAELLIEDGRVEDAERVIEALMSKEPDAIDGWLSLARLFGDRGDVGRAHVYVDRALLRRARAPQALALKVDLLHAQGRFQDALPVAEKLAKERGDSAGMRQTYLSTLLLAGERDDARELVATWLQDDGSEQVLLVAASAYEAAGLRREARKLLDDRSDGTPRRKLAIEAGRLALDDGDYDRAARLLCAVGDDEGTDWFTFARSLCGRALVRAGRPAEAAKRVGEALEKNPGSWRLLLALLDAAKREDAGVTPSEVLRRAEEALAKEADEIDLIDVVARAEEAVGDEAGAREVIRDALKARPDHADLLLLLARVLERQGDARGAVSIGDRLMLRDGPTLELLNFQAFTLADHELRPKEAEQLAWRALLRGPLNGYVVDTLGWAQFRAGRLEAARETLRRADRLSPGEPEILLHLAEVERALGRLDDARASVASARARFIDDERVQRRLDALAEELGAAS